jgi:hypothetical protein
MTPAASWPPALAPGKGRRFAVADPLTGKRFSTWRVWTGRNVDQVYLMEMETGPVWKVSLHNEPGRLSGEAAWRIAMTREEAESLGVERRVIDHWIPQQADGGWIEGVGVLIPFAYLRQMTYPLPPSVVQVPSSAACSGYSVRLFLEEIGAVGIAFPPGLPVAVIERCTGGRVYVLATPIQLSARQYEAFDLLIERARRERSDSLSYPTDRFVGVVRMETQRVLVDLTIT